MRGFSHLRPLARLGAGHRLPHWGGGCRGRWRGDGDRSSGGNGGGGGAGGKVTVVGSAVHTEISAQTTATNASRYYKLDYRIKRE